MKIVMEGPTFNTSLPEIKGKVKAIEDKAKQTDTDKKIDTQEEFSLDDIT